DAFDVIQNGIYAATSPGFVHVAEGYYTENIEIMDGVPVWGAGAGITIIDGDKNGPVVRASNVYSSTILYGFTLLNGETSGIGGGMYNSNASLTVANCIFRDNWALNGGGIGNDSSTPTIINCTFWNNTAGEAGNGIWNDPGSAPTVTNCILWVGPEQIAGGTPIVTFCSIEGGYSGAGSHDNIDDDPMLTPDFHLEFGSPCIDAGDNFALPVWLLTDFDGELRIADGNGD
ncbi:MAG: hypothetical protein GY869_27085, partial [Planctomycetes bacterium]|nr:hypothetical protein [Planctomycetota bacterium]